MPKPTRRSGATPAIVGHGLVEVPTESAPEVGLGPVAEQLGHDRDGLRGDTARVHRRDPGVDVPRLARDRAEVRTPDEDVGGVAVLHERGEPVVVPERQTAAGRRACGRR